MPWRVASHFTLSGSLDHACEGSTTQNLVSRGYHVTHLNDSRHGEQEVAPTGLGCLEDSLRGCRKRMASRLKSAHRQSARCLCSRSASIGSAIASQRTIDTDRPQHQAHAHAMEHRHHVHGEDHIRQVSPAIEGDHAEQRQPV